MKQNQELPENHGSTIVEGAVAAGEGEEAVGVTVPMAVTALSLPPTSSVGAGEGEPTSYGYEEGGYRWVALVPPRLDPNMTPADYRRKRVDRLIAELIAEIDLPPESAEKIRAILAPGE